MCFHAKQNLVSPALKLVLATEHTLTKALPIPLTHTHQCLYENLVCVQLANTYSQTGEAPWLSRVSVNMSVLMAVADLTHALLTDRELLYNPTLLSLCHIQPLSLFLSLNGHEIRHLQWRCEDTPCSHHFLQLHYKYSK